MAGVSISAEITTEARKSTAPKRSLASRVFGYDIFISFALRETERSKQQIARGARPRSTRTYASDLARRLQNRDITVFFSEYEAAPGEELDSTLRHALHRSGILVIIANTGMFSSDTPGLHSLEAIPMNIRAPRYCYFSQ